jgi:hypothetical protein
MSVLIKTRPGLLVLLAAGSLMLFACDTDDERRDRDTGNQGTWLTIGAVTGPQMPRPILAEFKRGNSVNDESRIERLRQAANAKGASFHVAGAHTAQTRNYFILDGGQRIAAAWDTLDEAEEALGVNDGGKGSNPANIGGVPNKAAMRKMPNSRGEPVSGMGQDVWFDPKTGMRWSEKEQKWF